MVTKLSGLTPFGIDGNALARECQKKYALEYFLFCVPFFKESSCLVDLLVVHRLQLQQVD